MTTAPSPAYQLIVLEIIALLRAQPVVTGWGILLTAPVGLFMPGCDPVQPDILAIRAADRAMIGARRLAGVPALLVEVLSPSNGQYLRVENVPTAGELISPTLPVQLAVADCFAGTV